MYSKTEKEMTSESQKTQKAIKQALNEQQLSLFTKELAELKVEIRTGFEGVHNRQDTTNGKVIANAAEISKLNSRTTPLERIVYGAVALILISVLGALLAIVITK